MAESTLRSRWSARWERAEGALTRIVLLAVFVVGLIAQFVKPVGDALQGKVYISAALLSLVGFALYSEVRRLNSGNEGLEERLEGLERSLAAQEDQQSAARIRFDPKDVKEELRRALWSGEDVTLSTLSFTGENFAGLKQFLGELPPNTERRVHLRILVPDFEHPIALPGLIRADGTLYDAAGFRAHLRRKISEYQEDLKVMEGRMGYRRQGRLKVEFAVLHVAPMLKLYVLNEDQVIEGQYDKFERRPDVYSPGGGSDELLDITGHVAPLLRWHRDGGPLAREMQRCRRAQFEEYWKSARILARTVPHSPGPAPAPGPAPDPARAPAPGTAPGPAPSGSQGPQPPTA
ncbi:ATP/GTP-binding protein [Streptomyces sp. NPDC007971]|uniref:ATP/GTP-binding protein n=1 Tax=Streptomyces sp. NPDC007971 TaxID=3364799 RepID=UPI0036E1F187